MRIADVEADFNSTGLVPGLVPSFNPSAVMTVTFPGVGNISPGQNLSVQQVATAPNVSITPANSSVPTTGNFTLLMVDSIPFGANDSSNRVLHWLTNSATLQSDSSGCPSLNVSTDGGLVVANYHSPSPPPGTGLHHYVILLFPQPASFSPPANLSTTIVGIDFYFHINDYVSSSNLGQPIAGMFFDVQAPPNTTQPL